MSRLNPPTPSSAPSPARPRATKADLPAHKPRGHWWSGRRGEQLGLVIGAALLEVLPISVWLQVWSAFTGGSPGDALLPLWLLLVTVLGAQWFSRSMRRQPASSAVVAALPFLLVVEAAGLAVSPVIYGSIPGEPFSFLGALGGDLLHGAGRLNAVFWMTVLLSYIWWRGLRAGRNEPSLEGLLTLFKVSFAVVVAGVIFAVVVSGFGQLELAGRLAILLPLEVFVGLISLSLARSIIQPSSGVAANSGPQDDRPWFSLSLLLAGGVVGAALLMSLVLSYDTLQAALLSLGPAGALLLSGISWLLYGFSYILFWIFGGLINYVRSLSGKSTLHVPTQPAAPKNSCATPNCMPTHLPAAQGIAVAIVLSIVLLGIIALVAYFVYRTLNALRAQSRPDEVWEAREALDGDPLRDLLAGLRRRAPRRPVDDTPDVGVRRVYRDVLAAATAARVGRESYETPDEFAGRLARALAPDSTTPSAAPDPVAHQTDAQSASPSYLGVAALTRAYDRARYGEENAPTDEQRTLRSQGDSIIHRLRAEQFTRRKR